MPGVKFFFSSLSQCRYALLVSSVCESVRRVVKAYEFVGLVATVVPILLIFELLRQCSMTNGLWAIRALILQEFAFIIFIRISVIMELR